ncbi:MAG: hypothetical protein HYU86_10010 [Chloroflexi bacterium]|nr:hypothetical protein [Chloroflexota bacterium]
MAGVWTIPAVSSLIQWLPQLEGRRVLVVGDVCLDEYIIGRARRLSREAPVPVLEFQRRFTVPGAAANPALNIHALKGIPLITSVVGNDEAGHDLCRHLKNMGLNIDGIAVDSARSTTVKTRVMAEVSLHFPQQLVRVDRDAASPTGPTAQVRILDYMVSTIPHVDAVLLSDYKGGVITPRVINTALSLAKEHHKITAVDSQGDLFKFKGCTLVKCNLEEAESVLRQPLANEKGFQSLGRRLQRQLMTEALVITRGNEGMSLIGADYLHIPAANQSEVFDVTGAGDTVIAILTLALAARAPVTHAAYLANYAAGLVVRKLGNATTTPTDLETAIIGQYAEGSPP